jgi:TFIIF-interacting CTD phosphatase-like protein
MVGSGRIVGQDKTYAKRKNIKHHEDTVIDFIHKKKLFPKKEIFCINCGLYDSLTTTPNN